MNLLTKLYLSLRDIKNQYPINPYKILRFFRESQFFETKELVKYQLYFFNKLISKAKKSNFYSSLYAKIDFIENINDIKILPIVTKDYYQSHTKEFITDNCQKGFYHASSGSTGKPTKIVISPLAEAYRKASRLRFLEWWGLKPEDKSINFTAYPRDRSTFINKLKNYYNPKMDIDIFSINRKNIYDIYIKINKYKPRYFRGYISVIKYFAKLLQKNHLNAKIFKLKVIIVTSEILYDTDRRFIENFFGCKVANEYGAAEGGLIAYECPNGGMHIQEETILLYTNSNNEIISTELFNDLTPLINYKIEDKIILSDEKCSCGRNLALIKRIEGRTGSDEIEKPDGTKLNYLFFDRMIKNLSDSKLWGKIKRFQVIQNNMTFNCYIVKEENYTEDVSSYIIDYIKKGIGKSVVINIIFTDDIKPEKNGKYHIFKRIV